LQQSVPEMCNKECVRKKRETTNILAAKVLQPVATNLLQLQCTFAATMYHMVLYFDKRAIVLLRIYEEMQNFIPICFLVLGKIAGQIMFPTNEHTNRVNLVYPNTLFLEGGWYNGFFLMGSNGIIILSMERCIKIAAVMNGFISVKHPNLSINTTRYDSLE
jgi:hypothetical protein